MNEYRKLKDVMLIYFQSWADNCNSGFWTGEMNGEIVDYHTKENLIAQAEKMGKEWIVLKHHKGKRRGEVTIAMQSKPKT